MTETHEWVWRNVGVTRRESVARWRYVLTCHALTSCRVAWRDIEDQTVGARVREVTAAALRAFVS